MDEERARVDLLTLLMAINNNDSDGVKRALTDVRNLNVQDEAYGYTPLIVAINNYTDSSIMSKLIEEGADVNYNVGDGQTPLMAAIDRNKPGAVKILLENNVNINKDELEAAADKFSEIYYLLTDPTVPTAEEVSVQSIQPLSAVAAPLIFPQHQYRRSSSSSSSSSNSDSDDRQQGEGMNHKARSQKKSKKKSRKPVLKMKSDKSKKKSRKPVLKMKSDKSKKKSRTKSRGTKKR